MDDEKGGNGLAKKVETFNGYQYVSGEPVAFEELDDAQEFVVQSGRYCFKAVYSKKLYPCLNCDDRRLNSYEARSFDPLLWHHVHLHELVIPVSRVYDDDRVVPPGECPCESLMRQVKNKRAPVTTIKLEGEITFGSYKCPMCGKVYPQMTVEYSE